MSAADDTGAAFDPGVAAGAPGDSTPGGSAREAAAGRRPNRLRAAWAGSVLGVRDFRLLSFGQLASTVGDYCYAVALPWFILSTARNDTALLGIVLACYGIPRTVLIPLGGSLSDRLSARSVMLTADIIRCGLVAVFAILAIRGTHSLVLLGPIAALIGAGEGVFMPASQAIMPTIIPMERLAAGNSISAAMVQAGSLAGPVLGGLLVASAAGAGGAFGLDAASFAISAVTLALITAGRRPAPAVPSPESPGAGIPATESSATESSAAGSIAAGSIATGSLPAESPAAGSVQSKAEHAADGAEHVPGETSVWSLLRRQRLLQVLIAVSVVANLVFAGTFEIALPALARADFGAIGYGTLIACFGVGALTGTLVAGRAGSLARPAVAACCAFLLGGAFVAAVPYLGGLAGAAAVVVVFGAAIGFGNIIMITLLQKWAPAQMLGRVMSLLMLASMGTFPVSVAVAGVLVKTIGSAPFFPVAGASLAAAVLAALTQRVIRDFGAASSPQPGLEPGPA
ncbi:MAG: MFS transporter [Actinomycetota bacterium]|nr:MFS transporter [Actinomycetota bacterium]